MMDIQHTMSRIQNARRAMVRAHDPKFRALWNGVADKLQTQLTEHYG